jgi:hypothetical protein
MRRSVEHLNVFVLCSLYAGNPASMGDREMIRIIKLFTFRGIEGSLDNYGFVCWGGMGFNIQAACPDLRAAIEADTMKTEASDSPSPSDNA